MRTHMKEITIMRFDKAHLHKPIQKLRYRLEFDHSESISTLRAAVVVVFQQISTHTSTQIQVYMHTCAHAHAQISTRTLKNACAGTSTRIGTHMHL